MQHFSIRILCGLALSSFLGTSPALAKTPPVAHDLGAGLHLSFTQVRDDTLVPLRFLGPGAGFSAGYAFDADPWRLETRLRVTASALFDRHMTPNAGLLPSFDVTTHRQLASFGETKLALGAWFSLHETVFYPASWDDAHAYWAGVTSLGPSARLTMPLLEERHLALELGTPIVALVSRPPRHRLYKVDNLVNVGFWLDRFARGPELTSIHELQAVRLRGIFQGTGRGFRIDPWAEVEIETFSQPARFIHASFYIGAEARFGL